MTAQLDRLNRRMAAIPKKVREAVKPALVQGANEVATAQRSLAPVDTGALRNSIAVTPPGMTSPPYSVPGGGTVAGPLEALVTAGNSDVRYAHIQEYGSVKNAAAPFFWPAFRLTRKKAATRIKRAIAKAVREGWSK